MQGFIVLFGHLIDSFGNNNDLVSQVNYLTKILIAMGCGAFLLGYIQVACWATSGQRQASSIRIAYFRALMRQEIGWYDKHQSGALSTQIAESLPKIQDAMGDKVASGIMFVAMFFAGIIVALVYDWRLTLVIISVSPLVVIAGAWFSKFLITGNTQGQQLYANAGGIADEALTLIKTVISFGTQQQESRQWVLLLIAQILTRAATMRSCTRS